MYSNSCDNCQLEQVINVRIKKNKTKQWKIIRKTTR